MDRIGSAARCCCRVDGAEGARATKGDQAVWDEVVRHLQNPNLIAQASIDQLRFEAQADTKLMTRQLAEL